MCRSAFLALILLSLAALPGCMTMGLRAAVDMAVVAPPETPGRALVYLDGEFIGTLASISRSGVRVVEGKHRVSVEKTGYYPFDAIVVSERQPIKLVVRLLKLPD